MKKSLIFLLTLILATGWMAESKAQDSPVGKSVTAVTITDANNNAAPVPYLGEKVLLIQYTDPDVKDVNDQLSDAVKARKFESAKYQGIGVANCKDTWLPNSAIRMKARQKEKQFPGSIVLLDADNTIAKAWGLGSCDEKGVLIIIGKDKQIKLMKKVSTQAESQAITSEVIKVLAEEIAK